MITDYARKVVECKRCIPLTQSVALRCVTESCKNYCRMFGNEKLCYRKNAVCVLYRIFSFIFCATFFFQIRTMYRDLTYFIFAKQLQYPHFGFQALIYELVYIYVLKANSENKYKSKVILIRKTKVKAEFNKKN